MVPPPRTKKNPEEKATYCISTDLCVCTFRRFQLSHHNGLKRISVCSIPFQQVLIWHFLMWNPSWEKKWRQIGCKESHFPLVNGSICQWQKFNSFLSSWKLARITELYLIAKNFAWVHTSWWHEISDKFCTEREKKVPLIYFWLSKEMEWNNAQCLKIPIFKSFWGEQRHHSWNVRPKFDASLLSVLIYNSTLKFALLKKKIKWKKFYKSDACFKLHHKNASIQWWGEERAPWCSLEGKHWSRERES